MASLLEVVVTSQVQALLSEIWSLQWSLVCMTDDDTDLSCRPLAFVHELPSAMHCLQPVQEPFVQGRDHIRKHITHSGLII